MAPFNFGPKKSNTPAFGSNNQPETSNAGNTEQQNTLRPLPPFGKTYDTAGFGRTSTAASTTGGLFGTASNATATTAGLPSQINSDGSTVFGASSLYKSATPTNQADQPTNDVSVDPLMDNYICVACKKAVVIASKGLIIFPPTLFQCWSCTNCYHLQCPSIFGGPPTLYTPRNKMMYFDLEICKNCHTRLLDPIPTSSLDTQAWLAEQPLKLHSERTMPRRSKRDPNKIPQSEYPDPVAILAGHFATGANNFPHSSHANCDLGESDKPPKEALFEIGDSVNLIDVPKPYPHEYQPFKVIGHFFNDDEESENGSDSEIGLDNTEMDGWEEDDSLAETGEDDVYELDGKGSWYYKLEKRFTTTGVIIPDGALWREGSLELALEDDSDDGEDAEDKDQSPPFIKIEDEARDGSTSDAATGEPKATEDDNGDSQKVNGTASSTIEDKHEFLLRDVSGASRPSGTFTGFGLFI